MHRQLLYAIATGIEQVVLQVLIEQDAAVLWRDVEWQIAEAAAQRLRWRNIAIGVVLAIVAVLILWPFGRPISPRRREFAADRPPR